MKTYPKWLSAAVLSAMLASPAAALETKAKNVILMDYDTGEYLLPRTLSFRWRRPR